MIHALHTADYSWSLRGLHGEALAEAKSACHLRSARKLVDVAFANGAIYIKAGQHVGQLVSSLGSNAIPSSIGMSLFLATQRQQGSNPGGSCMMAVADGPGFGGTDPKASHDSPLPRSSILPIAESILPMFASCPSGELLQLLHARFLGC